VVVTVIVIHITFQVSIQIVKFKGITLKMELLTWKMELLKECWVE